MAFNTNAQSSTSRHIGPIFDIDQMSPRAAPFRLTRPYVARSPVTPQRVEGLTIEPHASAAIAKGTKPADVAAEDPAEEPLEPCFRFHGFLVMAPYQTSMYDSSPSESFATNIAPAF